jgi:uncharacterized caspase-like protein
MMPIQKAMADAQKALNKPQRNNQNTIANKRERPNIYALIVGVSDYKYILDLRFCDDDATIIYNFLKSPQGGEVPDNQIRVLIDSEASKSNILLSMEKLFAQATKNDLVMFFFSGHGSKTSFCPYDENRNTTLSYKEISSAFLNCDAKYKVCIADACYSGGLNPEMLKFGYKSSSEIYYEALQSSIGGTAFILSSRNIETSLEMTQLGQGAFSYYYIKGLKGFADDNQNGVVSISELYEYVRQNVVNSTNGSQNPIIKGMYDSNMPIGVVSK